MTIFCIMLAAPRSGTTMLGNAVSRSFRTLWPQEIFHHQHAKPEIDFKASADMGEQLSFFNFRHDLFKRRPELSFPSVQNQSAIFDEFLKYLAGFENADRYLLDVKYTSWHHLDPYWRMFYHPPHLLTEVKRLRLPVVHLKRSNLFALYCSQKLALQTGVWHMLEERPETEQRLTIDVSDCARELYDIRATRDLFDRWLERYPVHALEYETLLTADGFSPQVEQTFTGIYGLPPVEPLSTVLRKVARPLRDVVVNKDEVLSAFRETDFQHMVEQALA